MGLVKHVAKEFFKEVYDKSREFFEFVLPPIDLNEENDNLIVTVDIPGFDKSDIKVSMNGNVLSINAEKKDVANGRTIMKQRPRVIDKKMRLPITVKEGEEKVNSAKYTDGVLTIEIPITKKGKEISLDKRFLAATNIPIIAADAIIPIIPSVSFDWNRNAEPKNTAPDKMLPDNNVFEPCLFFCSRTRFSSMNFFISGAIVRVSSSVFANLLNECLISSMYASLIKCSSSKISLRTLMNLKSTLCVW